jgi:hypothetical protein
MLAGAANLYHAAHTRRVSAAGLALLQAKLPRNSSQIARGRIRRFESYMPSQPVRLHRVILNVPTTVASAEASLGAIRPERTASVIAANTSGASGGVQAVTFDREEEYDQAGTSASECRRLLLGSAASDREDLVRDVLLPLHADRAINDPRRPFTSGRLPEIECRTLPST